MMTGLLSIITSNMAAAFGVPSEFGHCNFVKAKMKSRGTGQYRELTTDAAEHVIGRQATD